MFDYFEYVQFPDQQNIKMRYPKYREKFNVERNPEKYILDEQQLIIASGSHQKLIFGSVLTGTYVYFYYYFLGNLSKATHSKCNYILMKNILPSSLVVFGTSWFLGTYLFRDSAALRRHHLAKEQLIKESPLYAETYLHEKLENELRQSQ
jgi:hypothetical protein